MSCPTGDEPPGGRVPELNRLALPCVIAASGQDLCIRRKTDSPGLGDVGCDRVGLRRRIEAPDPWGGSRGQDDRSAAGKERGGAGESSTGIGTYAAQGGKIPDLERGFSARVLPRRDGNQLFVAWRRPGGNSETLRWPRAFVRTFFCPLARSNIVRRCEPSTTASQVPSGLTTSPLMSIVDLEARQLAAGVGLPDPHAI